MKVAKRIKPLNNGCVLLIYKYNNRKWTKRYFDNIVLLNHFLDILEKQLDSQNRTV